MQKFTIFSIILSLVVILTIADVLFHNYLNSPTPLPATDTTAVTTDGSTDVLTLPTDDSAPVTTGNIPSSLSSSVFQQAGFDNPTLKPGLFSGLVFEFLGFSDQSEASVYQWNLFSGAAFVGTVYEIKYGTDTGGFQGYLNLRDEAKTMSDLGTVNEVNNYGDASFYFNHKTKVNTVHLLIRVGASVYGFEYAQSYHETMKNVFDILKTLQ